MLIEIFIVVGLFLYLAIVGFAVMDRIDKFLSEGNISSYKSNAEKGR